MEAFIHFDTFTIFLGDSIAPIDALQLQSEVEQAVEQIKLRLASKKLEESSSIWSSGRSDQKLQVVGEEADLKVRKVSSTPFTPFFNRSRSLSK